MNYICDECGYVSDEPGLCPTCGVYLKKFDEETNVLTNEENFGTASDINFLGEEESLPGLPEEEDELDEELLEDSDEDLI